MTSRDSILTALRDAKQPFPDKPVPDAYLPMTPLLDTSPAALKARFVEEAEKLSCFIHESDSTSEAMETLFELLGDDQAVISWETDRIPIPNLAATMAAAGVYVAAADDPSIRVGLSGADAALAATGTLVVQSGEGKERTASLLPPVHVAVISEDQILADLESWVAAQRADGLEQFRQSSNVVLISGASRTADIAMQLILGMHGPGELHIIIVPEAVSPEEKE